MSTITIVGATGNVGSKTVKNLLGKGHSLKLIARHLDKLQQFAGRAGNISSPRRFIEQRIFN